MSTDFHHAAKDANIFSHLRIPLLFITTISALGLFNTLKNKHRFALSVSFSYCDKNKLQASSECILIWNAVTRRASAIPVLKSETVASNLPDRLVIVWRSLSRQKKVLVEEAHLVSFKLDCPTSYHK